MEVVRDSDESTTDQYSTGLACPFILTRVRVALVSEKMMMWLRARRDQRSIVSGKKGIFIR